jgi:hypothetical protein
MIASTVEIGRRNLDALETTVIKDNTIFPGEWYGGVLKFEDPPGRPPFSFRIIVTVGGDVHEVDVMQSSRG